MKLKTLDELGNEVSFKDIKEILVKLPAENGFLEKKMSTHGVIVLSQDRGEFEVKLSEFEKSGLKSALTQSFKMWVKTKSYNKEFTFDGGLSVIEKDGKKEILGAQ